MQTDAVQEKFEVEAMPHFTKIRKTALYLAVNKGDAEDLVQETFMQAWKSFGKYKLGTNCRAWLFQILMNKYKQYCRRHFIQAKYFQDAHEFVFQNAHSSTQISEDLTNKEVIHTLYKVPKLYRITIVLVDVYEFSYRETAEALNIPIGTVMSRLNRGRRLLREVFVRGTKNEALNLRNKVNYFIERYA